jgi:hypothetical protein
MGLAGERSLGRVERGQYRSRQLAVILQTAICQCSAAAGETRVQATSVELGTTEALLNEVRFWIDELVVGVLQQAPASPPISVKLFRLAFHGS